MNPITSVHLNTARSWRGGERQTLLLLEGLRQRGHQPILVCPPATPLEQRARAAEIPVHPLSMRGARDLLQFRRLIRARQPQIIQYHTAHAHSSGLLARWGQNSGAKTIVHRRVGCSIHRSGFPGLTSLKYGRSVDRYVVSSDEIARVLQGDGINKDRIEVVHDGVPPLSIATTTPSQIRQQLAVTDDALLIGCVASLTKEKGHLHLLDAIALLRHRQRPVHLILIGDGDQSETLKQHAKQHGIAERVHFTGFQPPETISSWLNALDLYLQPSLEEGLCTSILDAMNQELPVIASAVGGIPEMVEDDVTGRLVVAADSSTLAKTIDQLLDDPAGARELALSGAKRARQDFSADAMVEGNLALHRNLLEMTPAQIRPDARTDTRPTERAIG
ncbi:MAG: glycosyltransferase family 4 protein [Planctomycetota bacterium]